MKSRDKDIFKTSAGTLEVTLVGHASLMFEFVGKVIHVDPYSEVADYSVLPKADMILITHEHFDHLDTKALKKISKEGTIVIGNHAAASRIPQAMAVANSDFRVVEGIRIEAVPAYNIVNMASQGRPFHPKGNGNGYVITFGDKRVYVAGDTENVQEIRALGAIDIAFLPVMMPYTMSPEMVADAARALRPRILYPYHCEKGEALRVQKLLENDQDIEVRIR